MKIIFFGTPHFAAECLETLLDANIDIIAVVTRPDKPKGRSLQIASSEVKNLILQRAPQIPIFQPEKTSQPEFLEQLSQLKPDLFVVVVFGQILSQKLLDIPSLGSINVHPSLLPKFRGAAPVRRALIEGETETGVVIQKIVREMDAGDVLAEIKLPIDPEINHGDLDAKLLNLAKPLLLQVVRQYENGVPPSKPQDHSKATYAAKISIEEGEINWNQPAKKIHNLVRGFSPRPGAWCKLQNGKRLKILRTKIVEGNGRPGELILSNGVVACKEGAIQLLEVQPEGKKAMLASDWLRGTSKDNKILIVD